MQIFKHRKFHQWAMDVKLKDSDLKRSIEELDNGLYDANLGGNLYKKRIAINSRGKSAGFRTLVVFRKLDRAFFVYGYAKNKRANITPKEQSSYKKLAGDLLSLNIIAVKKLLKSEILVEVK